MKRDIDRLMKKLMDKKIREFWIGFETIGPDLYHYANELLYPVKMLLPARLGGGRFLYHASAFFKVEGEYDYGIVAEYGGKQKGNNYLPSSRESVYNIFEKYKYGKEGGLKIRMMSESDFKNKCNTTFVDYMKLIIKVKNIPSVDELLNKICYQSQWKRNNYDLLDHNCQDFVVKCIKELKAVRSDQYNNFRGYHNLALAHFPYAIIEQLEKNENDSSVDVDKIPIIGPIEEGIRAFFGLFA